MGEQSMSTSSFDPINMFWKMVLNAQECNQLALKVLLNTQKMQQSQQSLEQLVQEFMACVGDNTALAMSMLQSFSKVKSPEELLKVQEKVLSEYGEKNLEHVKKFFKLQHNLWQEACQYSKENATDFTEKCSEAAFDLTKKITENVTKFAETASTVASSCCAGNKNTGGNNKKHHNEREERTN